MIKRLIQNTVISALAFGVAALLGLLVIPLIIRTWGVTEFGLIVISRLLLPSGMMAVLDLGLSEVATQVVARAREHRNWTMVSRQIAFLGAVSVVLTLGLSAAIWLTTPLLVIVMKVDAEHLETFTRIMHYTALANLIFVPALVWEGIVKGFERYNLLRAAEVTSTAGYVGLTFAAASAAAGFEVVAYIYLATLVARAVVIGIAAFVALRHKHVRLLPWTRDIRQDILHRCVLLLQGKLMGGISGPLQPFLIGLLFGPKAVGTYDALVRLSRVSKIVVSLLTSALLPVASRLDERGSETSFQRLGDLGLVMMPMFVVPPLAATAILSPDIMNLWIGSLLAPYAFWMGLSFLVPICAQYVAMGSLIFLTRPEVQARLNRLMAIQLLIWAAVSVATLHLFAERALILGQVVGSIAVLPWQLGELRSALALDRNRFVRAIGTQLVILALASILLGTIAGYIRFDSVLKLALGSMVFCLITWVLQYFLVLEKRHRTVFPAVGQLMGLTSKSS
ncbi:oligosaccharide flippase family protein [Bradyrhizobium stylosanthis]|uniref:O-antigen/teichoic acid export membrane protein n=1 Tax=Bradyrhizobium stylosanthis TaxID=1803665 RepID=A0A560DY60_9BRAD|nr:oligosaccharide flippase family protein [Bradyrhizobium stylosanthis]TWB02013.1 O-antigen/teichoic acid export membrane protein [Bradyrhizobium stylosanthis]